MAVQPFRVQMGNPDWPAAIAQLVTSIWTSAIAPTYQVCGPIAAGLLVSGLLLGACCCGVGLAAGLVAGPTCRWLGACWIRQVVPDAGLAEGERVFVGRRQRLA